MSNRSEPERLIGAVCETWDEIIERTPPAVRSGVAALVTREASTVTATFYDSLLSHESSTPYLTHDVVRARLKRELEHWLLSLFAEHDAVSREAQVAQQIAVGAVHARIKLPVELLTIGAYVLGRELCAAVPRQFEDRAQHSLATHYLTAVLSLAIGMILSAFVRETRLGVRNEEAFRQAALGDDTALERERQRAALSEWVQRCLLALANTRRRAAIVPLGKSDFASWLRHKGKVIFDTAPEWETVESAIAHIDGALLPRLASDTLDEEPRNELLDDLESRIDFIRYTLNDLFERTQLGNHGRDAVTQLLNRRYLDALLANTVAAHAESGKPFVVVLVRVDIDRSGASLGIADEAPSDRLLQQVAGELRDSAGAGDYLFRYTDRDFLVVEGDSNAARSIERLERLVSRLDERLGTDQAGRDGATLRLALAEADGHPDFQRLLRRVELAISAHQSERIAIA